MEIELRSHKIYLSAGEMFVFPKGVEHKHFAKNECKIMVVEPQGIVKPGKAGGELTAPNDIWI
jgi:mannose-6-phosphate isomerase-like protein (cupin superfamily)